MSLIVDQVIGRENCNLKDIFKEIIYNVVEGNKKMMKQMKQSLRDLEIFSKSFGKRVENEEEVIFECNGYGYFRIYRNKFVDDRS